jgi:hypothetical protein
MFSRLFTFLSTTVLAISSIAVPAALSQCQYPVNPNGSDPSVARMLAGNWYNESTNRQLMYPVVTKTISEYLPTGVFSYKQQGCSNIQGYMSCKEYYGHGYWMATRQGNGIYVRLQFSDLSRTNVCTGGLISFRDANTFISQDGSRLR